MEATEQINIFREFFDTHYYAELLENIRKGKNFIIVDFGKLAKFNPELAENLLDHPEEVTKAAELAIEQFDLPQETHNFRIRFFNLPESQKIMIRNIRSKHIGKLLWMEGTVRQKSDVRPQVTNARFECPSCGNIIAVLQLDKKFREPSTCGCGRKGKFRLLSKELIDAQGLTIEEAPEDLEGGEQPKRIQVLLKEDLVSPITEKKTNPGSKIRLIGIIKEVPISARDGGQLTRFDLIIEGNNIEAVQEDFTQIEITDEEVQELLKISKDPKLYENLIESIAPSIYGLERIKEALLLQMVGGVRKVRSDGVVTRGDMHILLMGDPGAAKSQMLKRVADVAPKARFVSGKGASGAGLTAAVVRDEFISGWSLEAGALVLANKGICCTTEDSEFILENGKKISFKKLFESEMRSIIYPKFKILALNNKTLKIEPFEIKKAFKIKNNKKVYKIRTRTGRELNLTEDNEVLVCQNSKLIWKPIRQVNKGSYIAVPKKITINKTDSYSKEFAYMCGLVASENHMKINSKNIQAGNISTNKKTKIDIIKDKKNASKKSIYDALDSKDFAKKLILFGIQTENISTKSLLDNKILTYSDETISSFLKGIFDGGSFINLNPLKITLVAKVEKNARLFQELLVRLGIISSVKRSAKSWYCEIRGATNCLKFFKKIGTNNDNKFKKLTKINLKEVKEGIDVLPEHQRFFKEIIKKHCKKLGKAKQRYFWNRAKKGMAFSKYELAQLNKLLEDGYIAKHVESDILWDKIASIREIKAEYVYDFTMKKTNNFIANNIIMHNCIDEIDKMSQEDTSAMHEALEGQTVTISKANIQATLRAETTVLAAANPKFGRFDPYDIPAKQINLPPTLINRFDLLFPIKDTPDEVKDRKLATHILALHQDPKMDEPKISTKLLRKYIIYAKQNVFPKLTDAAIEEIKNYYVEIRNKETGEAGLKSVPLTARQLEALVRMTEANARLRLSQEATRQDAKRAIDLLHYCLSNIGIDPETGKFDIDRISTGITTSERSKLVVVREIINELENKIGKTIPIEDVVEAAAAQGVEESQVEEAIEKLKRSGDIFEPRRGFLSKI
ncbi:hypothetical protein DRJ17_03265 [Candidatus Woesearchaeota archaeon]|nr:MAG: hypothetical protein DRJ17_03265 [Candidatus Woesearchaeota archaeon]